MKIETVKNIIDTLPSEISKKIKRSNAFKIFSLKKIIYIDYDKGIAR